MPAVGKTGIVQYMSHQGVSQTSSVKAFNLYFLVRKAWEIMSKSKW